MFKKILLPYDGSDWSKRALTAAISVCSGQEQQCSITIFHVNFLSQFYFKVDVDTLQGLAEKLVMTAADTVLKAGIHCDSLIVTGNPAQEICLHANNGDYDLIVMGSRGLGDVNGMFLGSVSNKVLHLTSCPVLIVK